MFNPLTKKQTISIVNLLLKSLSERLEEKQLYLQVSEEVKEQIVNQGYDANFGARPLKKVHSA